MSHRALDEIAELRRRLGEVDAEIARLRMESVIDFGEMSDLRITRGMLAAQIEIKEEAMAL